METAKYKIIPPRITKAHIREYLKDEGCTDIRYSGKSGMFFYTDKSGTKQEHGKTYLTKLLTNKYKEQSNE